MARNGSSPVPHPRGPPLSLTYTIVPKAVGDQVLGQAEPTLSWGGKWGSWC